MGLYVPKRQSETRTPKGAVCFSALSLWLSYVESLFGCHVLLCGSEWFFVPSLSLTSQSFLLFEADSFGPGAVGLRLVSEGSRLLDDLDSGG